MLELVGFMRRFASPGEQMCSEDNFGFHRSNWVTSGRVIERIPISAAACASTMSYRCTTGTIPMGADEQMYVRTKKQHRTLTDSRGRQYDHPVQT